MYIGISSGIDNLRHLNVSSIVTVGDVLCYTSVKQHGFLGHNTYLRSKPLQIEIFDVMSANSLEEESIRVMKTSRK